MGLAFRRDAGNRAIWPHLPAVAREVPAALAACAGLISTGSRERGRDVHLHAADVSDAHPLGSTAYITSAAVGGIRRAERTALLTG
jgi:hypothetical protein